MENQSKFYINGAWVNPMGSETIEVINPSDESVVGTIAAGTKEDIDIIVNRQKKIQKGGYYNKYNKYNN